MEELKDILVSAGAIAGVASIIGLAVLAMLYFSQARDVRRLREWAGREPERASEVELRAAQIASQAIAQAYESMAVRQSEAEAAAAIAQEESGGLTVEQQPDAEPIVAGMEGGLDDPDHFEILAEQAAAAAAEDGGEAVAEGHQPGLTGDHPEPVVSGMEGASDSPEHFEQVEEQAAEAASEHAREIAASAESADPAAAPSSAADQPDGGAVPLPPTDDRPLAGSAAGDVRPSRLAPSTPAASRGQIPLPPLPPLDTSEFAAARPPVIPPDYYSSTEATGAGYYETVSGDRPPQKNNRLPFVVAGVLIAVFAIVLVGTQITGGDDAKKGKTAAQQRQERDKRPATGRRNPEINRPAVTVSVLNGTQTSGLAKLVGDKLINAGFTETTTGNRNDGVNHTTSTVYYAPGSKLEAQEVARELVIDSVKEIDAETAAAGASAPVVVVLGADKDQ